MRHTDEAYAMMLLTLPLDPGGEGALRPLSAEEFSAVAGQLDLSGENSLGSLMGLDVAGVMRLLGTDEATAYRLCLLMDRDMQLSRLIDECADDQTEIVTPFDSAYPQGVKRRLGLYCSPALFAKGNLELLQAPYLGILGISGVQTTQRARTGVRALVMRAAVNGLGVVAGDEMGACRAAREEALRQDARLVCALTGGLKTFARQEENVAALSQGNMLLLSGAHPLSGPGAQEAARRNRVVFALSQAAFVITTDGRRGEAEAARRGWCRHLYVYNDEAYPQNASLASRGFEKVDDLESFSVADRAEEWLRPDAEQLSFL
jgi:predicted Rossmann fold nucleotide-binding protein DprA/Smf involved in DNA uptake